MSKTLKWILIITGIVVVILVVAKLAGAFGKDEGTPVTAEKAVFNNDVRSFSQVFKRIPNPEAAWKLTCKSDLKQFRC